MIMRGLIDRITNRDVIEGLEGEVAGLEDNAASLGSRIKEYDTTVKRLMADIEEKKSLIQERDNALQEFEEKADTLSGTIRVLKMRFDTIFPASKVERKVDERDSEQN